MTTKHHNLLTKINSHSHLQQHLEQYHLEGHLDTLTAEIRTMTTCLPPQLPDLILQLHCLHKKIMSFANETINQTVLYNQRNYYHANVLVLTERRRIIHIKSVISCRARHYRCLMKVLSQYANISRKLRQNLIGSSV